MGPGTPRARVGRPFKQGHLNAWDGPPDLPHPGQEARICCEAQMRGSHGGHLLSGVSPTESRRPHRAGYTCPSRHRPNGRGPVSAGSPHPSLPQIPPHLLLRRQNRP